MLKNKTTYGLKFLLACTMLSAILSALLFGCTSKTDDEENIWASTGDIYSAGSITDSKAAISSNGDIVVVWQEQQTQVVDDDKTSLGIAASTDDHTSGAYDPPHFHKLLQSKTIIYAKKYTASSNSWGVDSKLKEGYLEQTKAGILAVSDAADTSKTVFDQNLNNIFVGDVAVSINDIGDVFVAWVQLGELIDPTKTPQNTGNANGENNLFVSRYNSASATWSAPDVIVTGAVAVQNKVGLILNDNNIAELVWLGRDDLSGVVNVYQNTYDGSAWLSPTMISDGLSTVRDIKLVQRNQTSGIALWSQHNKTALSSAETQLSLYSNWYSSSIWQTSSLVSNGEGEVLDFSVAVNASGNIWTSWTQTNGSNLNKRGTIWASEFTSTDSWSAAENIYFSLDSNDTSVAVDSAGNVVVAWVETGDGAVAPRFRKNAIIRANAYSVTTGNWLASSFIVSDTAAFATAQPIEKTIPNDHVAPKVVSTALNQFTISWQYWSVSQDASGYKLFSIDYDAAANVSSTLQTVSKSLSPVVNQMEMFAVDGGVQILWSQETGSGVSLKKSVK
ncbi:MAG: hypothetical protein OEM38_08770 [Gammaproteobacteria bacterium]|nr:hypothetical protein [Gammaproteobacteria bacterium]